MNRGQGPPAAKRKKTVSFEAPTSPGATIGNEAAVRAARAARKHQRGGFAAGELDAGFGANETAAANEEDGGSGRQRTLDDPLHGEVAGSGAAEGDSRVDAATAIELTERIETAGAALARLKRDGAMASVEHAAAATTLTAALASFKRATGNHYAGSDATPVTGFNLDEARAQGRFHANGSYEFLRSDRHVEDDGMGRDEWYHAEGGAKASAEAMLATAAKVSEARAARARAEAAAARRTVAPVDAWRTLAATLLAGAGESVLGALQRLGRRARPPVVAAAGTAKRSRRGAPAGLDDGGDTVEGAAVTQEQKEKEHALARDQIEALTAAAGALMESSDIDEKVYELTFEHALAKLEACLRAGDPAVTWEYCAIDALSGDGGTAAAAAAAAAAAGAEPTHGPFTTAQMLGWRASGYFIGEHAVLVRRIGGGTSATAAAKQLNAKAKAAQDFARDLVSDLDDLDDDDAEEEEEEEQEGAKGGGGGGREGAGGNVAVERTWRRSDVFDFAHLLLLDV